MNIGLIAISPLILLVFFLVAETILLASLKWASPLKSFLLAFLTSLSIVIYFFVAFLGISVFLATIIGEADPTKRSNQFTFTAITFLIAPVWMFLTSFLLAWVLKIFSVGKSALYALVLTTLRFLFIGFLGLIAYLLEVTF
jgi:hypothetical protein